MPTIGRKAGNKETGSGGFVGHVGNLDSRFKSLAYNIRSCKPIQNTIFSYISFLYYPQCPQLSWLWLSSQFT